ncbi:DUF535 family protein [Paraburkholderia caribensis]|uniref:DUF535 family protein n=1 Tax=Paraburkholderia caribensis TaxID=75105 RepID=UPI001CADD10E|nr:DUF535 family protein [Paraburkholderia caribensis]CAG9269388.1 conserved hypothetical protein [Paraburkholderia caribensis]
MRFGLAPIVHSISLCLKGASLVYPDNIGFHRVRRLRFLIRSLIWWRTTIPWLVVCIRSRHSDVVRRYPWIIERIHRPFLHRSLSPRQRLGVSVEHAYLSRALAPRIVNELVRDGLCPLAMMSSCAERWYVQVEMLHRFSKEGDWTLTIRDARGARLVSCTFSIATIGGKRLRPRLLIGCVQGPDRSMDGRDLYRLLTKQWYGLRPKSLIVYLAQSLADALGLQSVLMVKNESHVYSSWRYRHPKHQISADYRSLCSTLGSLRSWEGWFVLDVPQARVKDRQGITSPDQLATKREKRKLLKNSLDVQIRTAVHGCVAGRAREAKYSGTLF